MDRLSPEGEERRARRGKRLKRYRPQTIDATLGYHYDCRRKKRYRDRHEAKCASQLIQTSDGPELRPYHCHVCRGFHLSSQPER